jgi:hypothetical protein
MSIAGPAVERKTSLVDFAVAGGNGEMNAMSAFEGKVGWPSPGRCFSPPAHPHFVNNVTGGAGSPH